MILMITAFFELCKRLSVCNYVRLRSNTYCAIITRIKILYRLSQRFLDMYVHTFSNKSRLKVAFLFIALFLYVVRIHIYYDFKEFCNL